MRTRVSMVREMIRASPRAETYRKDRSQRRRRESGAPTTRSTIRVIQLMPALAPFGYPDRVAQRFDNLTLAFAGMSSLLRKSGLDTRAVDGTVRSRAGMRYTEDMKHAGPELDPTGRLIVALDVDDVKHAIDIVHKLPAVRLFKVGVPLGMTGGLSAIWSVIEKRHGSEGGIFYDLKTVGDIGSTVTRIIEAAVPAGVRFLTLSENPEPSINISTLATARAARERLGSEWPKILMVPLLSSLARPTVNPSMDTTTYIVHRGSAMMKIGCDGLIVSGEAIAGCRAEIPNALLVCPGIRPEGHPHHDHQRWTTPSRAIELGADYLVVGRPIIHAEDPVRVASAIISEITKAAAAPRKVQEDPYKAGFAKQVEAYDRMKENFERDHKGKWVVVFNEEAVGFYFSFEDAAEEAVRKFGRGPYLIKEVGSSDQVILPSSAYQAMAYSIA